MNRYNVTLTFSTYWQFKKYPYLKVTKCKKIINCKTGTILKYHTRGFYIVNEYIKRNNLNKHLELIPKNSKLPF
jgi:hypothetical protein